MVWLTVHRSRNTGVAEWFLNQAVLIMSQYGVEAGSPRRVSYGRTLAEVLHWPERPARKN